MSSFHEKFRGFRDSKSSAVIVSTIFIVISLVVSFIIHVSQKTFFHRALDVSAENMETMIIKNTFTVIDAVKRMGQRWQIRSGINESYWRDDAKHYLNDIDGVDVMMWIDAQGTLQWVEGVEGKPIPEAGFDFAGHGGLKKKMQLAKDNKLPEFTQVTKDLEGTFAIHVLNPIWKNGQFDGFIGIRINIYTFLTGMLGEGDNRGFLLHAKANDYLVFSETGDMDLDVPSKTFVLNLDADNDGWEFTVYPTREVLALFQSPLPYIVAIAGILIALLFFVTMSSRIKAKTNAKLLHKAIRQRQEVESKLAHMAKHDALTHLPNRSYLNIYLENKIKECELKDRKIAVLFLNIDDFKNINEIYDHGLADEVLKIIPKRINKALKGSAMIAHLGGDEYVICLSENLIEQKLFIYAEDVLKSIRTPITLAHETIRITASMGVSYFPQHGHTASELITRAEQAVVQAKSMGKDVYTIFDETLESSSVQKAAMLQAFNKGLNEQQFEMFFQPRHDIKTGAMVGAEALLRWNKDGKYLSPDEFLDLAEESGMIVNICNSAFDLAFSQYHHLFSGNPPIMLAINVSAKQLSHPDFLNDLFAMMEAHEFPSEMLEVELTEQTLIQNYESSLATLNALHSAGVKIALDDFGTGYSSLSYLKNFPVDVLKIDKSFIKDIHKNKGELELAKAIIAMGNSLKMEVVAEGVENQKQLSILKEEGCQQAQGFYLNKPLPFAQFDQLFNNEGRHSNVHS